MMMGPKIIQVGQCFMELFKKITLAQFLADRTATQYDRLLA